MRLTETLCSSELCSEGTISSLIPVSDQRCLLIHYELLFSFLYCASQMCSGRL